MERKLIMEPIKKSDMGELCFGGNILVDSCIKKLFALTVMLCPTSPQYHSIGKAQ